MSTSNSFIMMKIAFINQPWNFFPPRKAGSIAIWNNEIIKKLPSNYSIFVYAQKHKSQKREETTAHYKCIRFSIKIDRWINRFLALLTKITKADIFSSKIYFGLYAYRIARHLHKIKCDIVHIHNFSQFVDIIRRFNPEIKIVLHMHCEWLTQLDPDVITKRLSRTAMILSCSQYIQNKIKKKFPSHSHKSFSINNGVDLQYFYPIMRANSKGKELLYVGRMTPEKGIHILLDALKLVQLEQPEVSLKIIGPNARTPYEFLVKLSDDPKVKNLKSLYKTNYTSYLHNKITAIGLKNVEFVGFVQYNQLLPYYQKASILIQPSFSESFGMSVIEAMACGISVICTKVGGMPEIIENAKTGILVEPGDSIQLSAAILAILSREPTRKSISEASRRNIENYYSWKSIADQLNKYYLSLY